MSAPANYDTVSAPAKYDTVSAEAIERETDIAGADELIESADLTDSAVAESVRDSIRVVKGNPSDEDIAALVAVLTAAAASASTSAADTRPPELWGTPASMHRTYLPYSPSSFAASQRY